MTEVTKKVVTKKASKKKAPVKKKGPSNTKAGMARVAKNLKKGVAKKRAAAKKASKKKAPVKKKAPAKKKVTANAKVEKKIAGKTVVGMGKLYQLKPQNIVVVDGFNPRIDMGDMPALMRSIKRNGVKVPITVRKVGKHYELVNGERRLRAVLKLGLDKIPALLETSKMSSQEVLNLALVTNDSKILAPVEEADAFRNLVNAGWSAKQISVATGKSIRLVKDRLTLISAHPDVAKAVKAGKLSVGLGLQIAKKAKTSKKKQAKKVKEATRGDTAKKRVAAQLGKASLRAKIDKKKIALQNRLNKLVVIVNKRRKKADKVPASLSAQVNRFSKHKDKEVRAAFVAGGVYALTEVTAAANTRKTVTKKKTTARPKSGKGKRKA